MMPRSQIWLLAVLGAAAVMSAVSGRLNPYWLDVAMGVGINIILAVSLNLINGFTGQFSLGHAGFMAVGAYTSAMLTTVLAPKLGVSPAMLRWGVFPVSLVAGGLLAGLAGLAVGAPSLRLKGDYLAIVTLGFGEIIKVILQNVDAVGGAKGLSGILSYTNLFWTFGIAAVTIYVVWGLLNSTYGRGFLAVADDEVAAEAMGLNTTRYKINAFVVGSFFAGAAGGLYAHLKGYISPTGFDFNKSIEIVVMVILGGMGRHVGVVLAAVFLTLVQEPLRELGDSRMIVYAILLCELMLARNASAESSPFIAGMLGWAGRIGRARFVVGLLILSLSQTAVYFAEGIWSSKHGVTFRHNWSWVVGFGCIIPYFALYTKRLQDVGWSRWWSLGMAIPGINLVLTGALAVLKGLPGSPADGAARHRSGVVG